MSLHLGALASARRSQWLLLVVIAAAATGCKDKGDQGKQSEPAAPALAAVKDPLALVPQTDGTLSLLEPRGGQCEWLRVDPDAQKRAVVASFEGDCQGARVAWAVDGRKAAIWFDPRAVQVSAGASELTSAAAYPDEIPIEGAAPRLYEVTVTSGQVREVPFPAVEGRLVTVGYKGQDLLALSLKSLADEKLSGDSVMVDGRKIELGPPGEGLPALAFAYRLEAGAKVRRVEVTGTREGADVSEGISALDAASGLGPRSAELLVLDLRSAEGSPPSAEQQARLAPFLPAPVAKEAAANGMPEDMGWIRGVAPPGAFYVWQISSELSRAGGPLVLEAQGRLVRAKDLGFTDGDLVAVSARGPFVLVAAERVGTHPRLYDLRSTGLAFRSDTARATTFWPRASE